MNIPCQQQQFSTWSCRLLPDFLAIWDIGTVQPHGCMAVLEWKAGVYN